VNDMEMGERASRADQAYNLNFNQFSTTTRMSSIDSANARFYGGFFKLFVAQEIDEAI